MYITYKILFLHAKLHYKITFTTQIFLYIRSRIIASEDKDMDKMLDIPAQEQWGQVVKPAKRIKQRDYDMEKLKEELNKIGVGMVVLSLIHYNWNVRLLYTYLLVSTSTFAREGCYRLPTSFAFSGRPGSHDRPVYYEI